MSLIRPIATPLALPLRRALTEVRGGGAFNPASLFAGGAQGVLYDFTDAATLFQDSAGTTAIAAGQGIGLVLDKSQGGARGSELVSNGTFDANIDGWEIDAAGAAISWSAGRIVVTSDANGFKAGRQAVPTVIGKTYIATARKTGGTATAGKLYVYSGSAELGRHAYTSSAERALQVVFTATTTSTFVKLFTDTASATSEWDDISVRELPGNHATQTATASKPLWQTTYSGYDGFDDFLVTPSIDFTGTNAVTVVAGIRKESDAALGMLIETSTDGAANNGAFFVRAPQSNGATNISFGARGTTLGHAFNSVATAPISAVVSGEASITAPYTRIRTNGVLNQELTTSLGTGPLGNFPLYIGRRGGTAFPFSGRIHRLLIIGRALTAAELAQAERWAAQPTGVTLP